jgi:hypothetical protein
VLCSVFLSPVAAPQQVEGNTPASKDDIERYLQVTHSRDMINKMVDAMRKPMQQFIHEEYLKDKERLPADFEERMNKRIDEFVKGFPFGEMIDSMVPIYQKHLTRGDVDALMPMLRKRMDIVNQRMHEEGTAMLKESPAKTGQSAPQENK